LIGLLPSNVARISANGSGVVISVVDWRRAASKKLAYI